MSTKDAKTTAKESKKTFATKSDLSEKGLKLHKAFVGVIKLYYPEEQRNKMNASLRRALKSFKDSEYDDIVKALKDSPKKALESFIASHKGTKGKALFKNKDELLNYIESL